MYDKPLLPDCFEACKYGPVYRNLYNDLKHFGPKTITQKFNAKKTINDNLILFFTFIWARYSNYTDNEMMSFINGRNGSWNRTIENCEKTSNCKIDNSILKEEYKEKYAAFVGYKNP